MNTQPGQRLGAETADPANIVIFGATGDLTKGMLDYGRGACFADAIEPAEAIIDRIVDEAVAACERIGELRHAEG